MTKIQEVFELNIGILGCSEIAYRRFMPAIQEVDEVDVLAVAEEYDPSKLDAFCKEYSLERENSFENLINRNDIDAVYVPQPPALHYKWAKRALECGKHVLVEKPSTTEYRLSEDLVNIANKKGLVLHENYMFQYHSQIHEIQRIIQRGEIGDIRLIRANFGFPLRGKNDFRYSAKLGGGALLDAGGYTVKLASIFLGNTIKVNYSKLMEIEGYEVDMYGSAVLSNDEGCVCQVGFGMDCHYQCCLEIWGSQGRLYTDRIFTAPPGYEPIVIIEKAERTEEVRLSADWHFCHSIDEFYQETLDLDKRNQMYDEILLQAKLVEMIRNN